MGIVISRRELLQWLGLATASGVAGCTKKGAKGNPAPTPAPDAGGQPPPDPWAVLDEVRAAVRQSPDHLGAQAERLVAAKDADAIFAFVRDAILTLPVFGDIAGTAEVRWGARGTLRGGLGTPRDKAELLLSLLQQAGFDAQMMQGKMSASAVTAEYQRQRTLTFAPAADEATLQRWRTAFGLSPTASPPAALDPDGHDASALGDALFPLVPASVAANDPGSLPAWMPLVQLTRAGATLVANPFVAGAALGEANATEVQPLGGAGPMPRAFVRLQYSTTENPYAFKDAVIGDWGLDQLVGRRLHAQLQPLLPSGAWLLAAPASVPAWAPMLTVQGGDVDRELAVSLSVTGDVLKPDGNTIQVSGSDLLIDGRRVPQGQPDPALVARVHSASLSIDPSTFPQVSARLVLLDADGHSVAGLTASAFTLTEEGTRRPALVAGALDTTQRIAILFDGSTSVPDQFRLPDNRASLARAIADGVHANLPSALLRVAGIDSGLVVWSGDWTTDANALDANARAITAGGDQLWGAYAGAVQAGASMVVIVSDGLSTDDLNSSAEPLVRAGPPAVCLAVADAQAGIFPELTKRTGGRSVAVANQTDAVAVVVDFAGAPSAFPFAVTWPAVEDGPSTRAVVVQVLGTSVSATASYDVPPASARAAPLRIAGLYLSVGFSYENAVMRRLAGKAPGVGGTAASDADCAEAFAALSGAHLLSFEGGPPPFAHWADEWISAALANRPLVEAVQNGDGRALMGAVESGQLRSAPVELAALHADVAGGGSQVYPEKCRVVRLSSLLRPANGGPQRVARTADILGVTRFAALGADRDGRLRAALRASARLALVEGQLGSVSTYARLRGAALQVGSSDALLAAFPSATTAQLDAWSRLVAGWEGQVLALPQDPGVLACWAIHPSAGSVLGVIDDGSGGAREEICAVLHDAQSMLAAVAMLGTAAGASAGLGIFLTFAKTYFTLILESAVCIARLEEGSPVPDLNRAALDLACDLVGGAIADHMGGSATAFVASLGTGFAYAQSLNDLLQAHNASNLSCSNQVFGQQQGVCP